MKYILGLVFIVLLTSFKGDTCRPEYGGIYVFKIDNENSAVLRFYEDGSVIASTSVNNYKKVITWFHKGNVDMVLSGKYKVKKCKIKFKVKGMTGEQEYKGIISGQSITFDLTDGKSKAVTQRTYTFVKLEGQK